MNSEEHPNRQRFTLAHEIAHFVLHKGLIEQSLEDDRLYRSVLGGAKEAQANRLAADILMPVHKVREVLKDRGIRDLNRLAEMFRVSVASMSIRLNSLELSRQLRGGSGA